VLFNALLGVLVLMSLALTLWQWVAGLLFPLHRRASSAEAGSAPVSLLKPLKGCDAETEACLRSWLTQDYSAAMQFLFGVASAQDPVCALVRRLLAEFPSLDAQLVICEPLVGTNLKVAKLVMLEKLAKHPLLVVSDADVRVPADLLKNILPPFAKPEVGLVNVFYRLMGSANVAMRWEALAVNADFWSQVLQSQMLQPLDFALGAVMAARRQQVHDIGGFEVLANCLADDYQLGHRIAGRGHRVVLSPVVVECWSEPMGWSAVWKHQLRWARTIRVCQPGPYFLSILSNGTLWPLVWIVAGMGQFPVVFGLVCLALRGTMAWDLQRRLAAGTSKASPPMGFFASVSLAWLKDLLQTAIWVLSFLGNHIEWRGEKMRLNRDGTLSKP
jgi:ceramide glucosyltransferase